MNEIINILLVENSPEDAALILQDLKENGFLIDFVRVQYEQDFRTQLENRPWDLVISDYDLDGFNGLDTLRILSEKELEIPFILVSGTQDEFAGNLAMQRGARDYVSKDNIKRLAPAIERELREARIRKQMQKAEKSLFEWVNKHQTLIEKIKDMVYVSTPDGKFVDINPAGLELLGYKNISQLNQINIGEHIFTDKDQYEQFIYRMRTEGYIKEFETEFFRTDRIGINLTVRITATTMYNDKGFPEYYMGIVRDITNQRIIEDHLQQTQKLEAMGELTGGLAHDFKNILGIILSNSELALLKSNRKDEVYEHLVNISKAVHRGDNLIQKLLSISRNQQADSQKVDLNSMIRDVHGMVAGTLKNVAEINLKLSDESINILADPSQFEQILINLIFNARDALADLPGQNVNRKIELATDLVWSGDEYIAHYVHRNHGTFAKITISDSGIGMNDTVKTRIFEPFFTTKSEGKGTGLGLSTVYSIVKQNHGYIYVDSKPGEGTVFTVYWPSKDHDRDGKPAGPAFMYAARRPMMKPLGLAI